MPQRARALPALKLSNNITAVIDATGEIYFKIRGCFYRKTTSFWGNPGTEPTDVFVFISRK